MPRVAYAQPGSLPSAFCPVPAHDGRGFGPWDASPDDPQGQPGTMGVPTGLAEFGGQGLQANGAVIRGGGGGYAQGSSTMPPVWYPQLYWQQHLTGSTLVSGNVQTMSVYSDNQMPIPATDPMGRAAMLAQPPQFLGQGTLNQPGGSRGPARWPSYLPSRYYGA